MMEIRDVFNKCLRNNYDEGLRLMLKKNADYADITDPFANFKVCEIIGVNYKRGILVRALDKIKRIGNLLGRQAKVKDETIEDTLLDAMNYMNILLTALQFEKDKISVPDTCKTSHQSCSKDDM